MCIFQQSLVQSKKWQHVREYFFCSEWGFYGLLQALHTFSPFQIRQYIKSNWTYSPFHLNSAHKCDVVHCAEGVWVISANQKPTSSTENQKNELFLNVWYNWRGVLRDRKCVYYGNENHLKETIMDQAQRSHTDTPDKNTFSWAPGFTSSWRRVCKCSEELLNNSRPVTWSGRDRSTSVFSLCKNLTAPHSLQILHVSKTVHMKFYTRPVRLGEGSDKTE